MEEKEITIPNGKLFLECSKEELKWAKNQDSMTNYYIEIWANPGKNAMQLCDPMWLDGKWTDFAW